jgi:anaerobic magnesium-protoporphyrin IX monomethyl ester cyclase
MKILLCRIPSSYGVRNEHPENIMMPVEMASIAAIAREQGAEVDLLDLEAEPISIDALKAEVQKPYDYIVLRAKTPSFAVVKEVFSQTPAKIIGIGHLFHTKSSQIYELTDLPLLCGIKGETDTPFRMLLQRLVQGEPFDDVPNLIYRNADGEIVRNPDTLLQELDELPSPDYALFDSSAYYTFYPVPFGTRRRYGFMMASRGCPYDCSFCSPTLRNSFGKKMRFHSPERMVDDMRELQRLGKTIVHFRDDIFTVDKKYVYALCEKMIEADLGMKWCAQTHINCIDEDLLSAMSRAGCVSLGFGLESGSEKILKTVMKTNKIDRAPGLVRHAKKVGIKTVCFFLVGCPGENEDDHRLSLELLNKTMPNLIQVAFFTPYPGSTDYETYIGDEQSYNASLHHYNNYRMNFTELSTDAVEAFHKTMYKTWFFAPSTLVHTSLSLISDLVLNPGYFRMYLAKGSGFLMRLLKPRELKPPGLEPAPVVEDCYI